MISSNIFFSPIKMFHFVIISPNSNRMLSFVSRSCTAHATRWSSIRCFSDVSSRFEAAQVKLNTLTEDPGNAAKLKIYGLFKQVLCNIYLHSTATF